MEGSGADFGRQASHPASDGSPEKRAHINQIMRTSEGESKSPAVDYGAAGAGQSASFHPKPINFAIHLQAGNSSNIQGLQSLNSPESSRSPEKQQSPTNVGGKQGVNFMSGVLTQTSKNAPGQARPQLPTQQIHGQLSPPQKQGLAGTSQNPLSSVLLQPAGAQQ